MNNAVSRNIKTGKDPRKLPEYRILRDELSKLSHPACPDINWPSVEQHCLSLFEHNGVELQTAAWYTLARTHLTGLFGLNEGLAILNALIGHQWQTLWPQQIPARFEILISLSQRLQQWMRTLPLNRSDLCPLSQTERQLELLGEGLRRLGHQPPNAFVALSLLMHNTVIRLKKCNGNAESDAITQADSVLSGANTRQWVYVTHSEQPPPPAKNWTFFSAGMGTMLVIIVVAFCLNSCVLM